MPGAIYQHAVGVLIEICLPTGLSLAGATLRGEFRKPDGSVFRKPVTVVGQTASYVTVQGDLNFVGQYAFQVIVTYTATGKEFPADPFFFRVWPHDRQGA